jgi:tetratricopeptide (TPR) repeat protein
MGRQPEAQEQLKLAQELDPLSPTGKSASGMSYLFARDYDRAIEQLRRASELDPDFWWPRYFLGVAYKQKGMDAEARSELRKAMGSAASAWPSAYLGYVDAASGKRTQALMALHKLQAQSKTQYVSPYSIAIIYLGLGEKVEALDWLEKAYDERDDALVFLALDPTCDGLRQEPRFRQLVWRIGLP